MTDTEHATANTHHQKPAQTKNKSITLSQGFPGHEAHWRALIGDQAPTEWIHQALEEVSAQSPTDSAKFCLLSNHQAISTQLVFELSDQAEPSRLVFAVPAIGSPHRYQAQLLKIWGTPLAEQSLLELDLGGDIKVFAYNLDHLRQKLDWNQIEHLEVSLSGLALDLECSEEGQLLHIRDAKSIEQHRALIEILLQNEAHLPSDSRAKIKALIDEGKLPKEPITLSLDQMCAYLYSDELGQQDEAWCRGEVIGKQLVTIFSKNFLLLDIVVLRDPDTLPVVIRIAVNEDLAPKPLKVGDFVQGNIWLQASICVKPG
jgi:hypothetical protein